MVAKGGVGGGAGTSSSSQLTSFPLSGMSAVVVSPGTDSALGALRASAAANGTSMAVSARTERGMVSVPNFPEISALSGTDLSVGSREGSVTGGQAAATALRTGDAAWVSEEVGRLRRLVEQQQAAMQQQLEMQRQLLLQVRFCQALAFHW